VTITAVQRVERMAYIGGSDAAGVLGLSRWDSPLRVWAEKTGAAAPEEKDRFEMDLGTLLEDDIIALYEKASGRKVMIEPKTLHHPIYPFLAVNLDGRLDARTDFEAKTAGAFKSHEWKDNDVPQEYVVQGFHSMMVTGKSKHTVACLLLGGGAAKLVYKDLLRDEEIIAEMLKAELHFWRTYVVPKRRPPQVTKNDGGVLSRMFPREDGGAPIVLGEEANRLLDAREALLADKRVLEGELDRVGNQIKVLLGEKSWGKSDRWRVSWRNERSVKIDERKLKRLAPKVYAQVVSEGSKRVLRASERRRGRTS
jgi:putative phage-type endonuclease